MIAQSQSGISLSSLFLPFFLLSFFSLSLLFIFFVVEITYDFDENQVSNFKICLLIDELLGQWAER